MSEATEVLVTSAGNVAGYALAAVVLIWLFRKGNPTVGRIGTAAWVLFLLWITSLVWYVATEYWLGSWTINTAPEWLEASNGIAENNTSEVWQVWLAMLIFKHLREPGSPESKE
jgi:amino acid transporter